MEGAGTEKGRGGWTEPGLTGDAGARGCLGWCRPGRHRGRPSVAGRPVQSCSLPAPGAVPMRTTEPVGLRLRRGPDAQLAAGETQPPSSFPPTQWAPTHLPGLRYPASWGGGGRPPLKVQFAGTLALQREPLGCLCRQVRARWARGGPRGAACIVGVLCPDPRTPSSKASQGAQCMVTGHVPEPQRRPQLSSQQKRAPSPSCPPSPTLYPRPFDLPAHRLAGPRKSKPFLVAQPLSGMTPSSAGLPVSPGHHLPTPEGLEVPRAASGSSPWQGQDPDGAGAPGELSPRVSG